MFNAQSLGYASSCKWRQSSKYTLEFRVKRHDAARTQYLRYRYPVSDGAASTHGLNTVTRAFSKSPVSRETIVKS
jgi:hypothetical protein